MRKCSALGLGLGVGPERTSLGVGLMADSSAHRTIAVGPTWRGDGYRLQFTWRAWDATDTAVFIGYENQLYRVDRE